MGLARWLSTMAAAMTEVSRKGPAPRAVPGVAAVAYADRDLCALLNYIDAVTGLLDWAPTTSLPVRQALPGVRRRRRRGGES